MCAVLPSIADPYLDSFSHEQGAEDAHKGDISLCEINLLVRANLGAHLPNLDIDSMLGNESEENNLPAEVDACIVDVSPLRDLQ